MTEAIYGVLIDNWREISGEYALRTGLDLGDLDAHLLFNVGYYWLYRRTSMTEEEFKAREKLEQRLRDVVFERQTGAPAIVRGMVGADGSVISPFD